MIVTAVYMLTFLLFLIGLFTVLTEGIGDISGFVAENRLGEVIKGLSGEELDKRRWLAGVASRL